MSSKRSIAKVEEEVKVKKSKVEAPRFRPFVKDVEYCVLFLAQRDEEYGDELPKHVIGVPMDKMTQQLRDVFASGGMGCDTIDKLIGTDGVAWFDSREHQRFNGEAPIIKEWFFDMSFDD